MKKNTKFILIGVGALLLGVSALFIFRKKAKGGTNRNNASNNQLLEEDNVGNNLVDGGGEETIWDKEKDPPKDYDITDDLYPNGENPYL
jgi:LPXTG-motif cell wall-anchored protein